MKGVQPPDRRLIDAWWEAVLAGQVDETHPVHGDDVHVSIKHGVLHLAGEVASREAREDLLKQARRYVGRGIDDVDATHLRFMHRRDKPGILDQTLIAAFPNRDVAELARKYLVEMRHIEPKMVEIFDSGQEAAARRLVPEDFMDEIRKAFKSGQAVLILRVDEVDAFKVREMLAEDTRSVWTVSTPPIPALSGR
jgi:hypothetical protein